MRIKTAETDLRKTENHFLIRKAVSRGEIQRERGVSKRSRRRADCREKVKKCASVALKQGFDGSDQFLSWRRIDIDCSITGQAKALAVFPASWAFYGLLFYHKI